MLDKLFFGTRLHENADAAQRVLGISALAPDSPVLLEDARQPTLRQQVRAAAAERCGSPTALLASLKSEAETEPGRPSQSALGNLLATSPDATAARSILDAPECTDEVRAELALRTQDDDRRRAAIDGIGNEDELVRVALDAGHASVRIAAAERVRSAEPLRRLLKGSMDKDRGVARLARERLDVIQRRIDDASAADALIAEAEALVARPGPIVMAAVELDRRWSALALGDDAERRARWDEIGREMKERFDRDLEQQRAHTQFEQRLNGWLASLEVQASITGLPARRETLAVLRAEADTRK